MEGKMKKFKLIYDPNYDCCCEIEEDENGVYYEDKETDEKIRKLENEIEFLKNKLKVFEAL